MQKRNKIKLLSLISGGIDSPVATYLMIERGAVVDTLYLDNRPFTDEKTKNKVRKLVDQLRKYTGATIKLYVIPHGNNQKMFARNCNRHLGCLLCRRMMLRLGEHLANKINANGLITGESLGQVASQTLQNLNAETQAIKIPIIRPLIGLDKLEIEGIAQKIGTYNLSILPGLCCTIVPQKPNTNADLNKILQEERKVDIDNLLQESLEKIEVM